MISGSSIKNFLQELKALEGWFIHPKVTHKKVERKTKNFKLLRLMAARRN
jgi:hypothetical protein